MLCWALLQPSMISLLCESATKDRVITFVYSDKTEGNRWHLNLGERNHEPILPVGSSRANESGTTGGEEQLE